ncbi:MAG TPA: alpha/beta hydrolase-fold protein [Thermohalobaculum sp.]|nr:alpha/beta hydrolase-fold protein [Thermohalobaculum sp.]
MREVSRWHSPRLGREVTVARWGHWGTPVLLFPTAGGDALEIERMGVIEALGGLLAGGRIKVYSCDSVAGQAWIAERHPRDHLARLQDRFDGFVREEIVPAIRADTHSPGIEVVAAGASIGAFNAVAALCRHPDVFRSALALSGTYDIERMFRFGADETFRRCSPLLFLPNLGEGAGLDLMRRRFVLLAFGQGRWEDPGESWRMAEVLGAKGIPNRVDPWGGEWDHDWSTWRHMLPHYLEELTG